MDHYIDIQLLPDPEFTVPLLMGALYNKLHRSLVMLNADDIGVSFPGYQLTPRTLGNRLRLHGKQNALHQLLESGWLKGMADHIAPVSVLPVPDNTHALQVRRKQYQTNAERLRRRRMKRKGESYEQACSAIPDQLSTVVDRPFLTIRSQSTEQSFALFIDQQQAPQPVDGCFNRYGLSQTATVPGF